MQKPEKKTGKRIGKKRMMSKNRLSVPKVDRRLPLGAGLHERIAMQDDSVHRERESVPTCMGNRTLVTESCFFFGLLSLRWHVN